MKQPNYITFNPNFELDRSKLENFLRTFENKEIQSDQLHKQHKYMIALQSIANKESKILEIHIEDLESFLEKDNDTQLLDSILKNTKRYIQLFYEAIDKVMPQPNKKMSPEEALEPIEEILLKQRMQNITSMLENKSIIPTQKKEIPAELLRKYEVVIVPGPGSKIQLTPMRGLKAEQLGSLVTIQGIVVRATDVKPFLKVACYSCDICGCEIYQTINSRVFMPLVDCTSEQCRNNNSHGKITQMNRTSKFLSFQEIKVQEPTHQVPVGHVPRSLTVFALGQCVRQCVPGDTVTIHGIYLPSVITGSHAFKSRLIHDTYVEAFKIVKEKKSYKDTVMSEEMFEKFMSNKKQKKNDNTYANLAKSIAPEIFGMDDIKKALLLLLVGGVDKEMEDGMKIRGNINILLMGDPGIAKSQLLKYISNISPRGVYTTGKGSSGVGLTAAVVKDPITNDLVLEGGALVLADMGVCCIDEFDKMSDYDRANIHEVMEQQTVSIAKAGITTRLNARTSVLAAANPLYGRYDSSKTPHENINLPAALLSRFDLIFLLLDKPNTDRDFELAKHVAYVHKHSKPPELSFEPFEPKFIRGYIAAAKKNMPLIPKDLHNFIIQKYVEKRKDEADRSKQGYQYITPRSLLAIIRLAQALAKLRMNEKVEQSDVDEALRLVEYSKSSIEPGSKDDKQIPQVRNDTKSIIYNIVRELCAKKEDRSCSMDVIERKVTQRGYKKKQLENMLEDYVNLNILYVDQNGTEVTLL